MCKKRYFNIKSRKWYIYGEWVVYTIVQRILKTYYWRKILKNLSAVFIKFEIVDLFFLQIRGWV